MSPFATREGEEYVLLCGWLVDATRPAQLTDPFRSIRLDRESDPEGKGTDVDPKVMGAMTVTPVPSMTVTPVSSSRSLKGDGGHKINVGSTHLGSTHLGSTHIGSAHLGTTALDRLAEGMPKTGPSLNPIHMDPLATAPLTDITSMEAAQAKAKAAALGATARRQGERRMNGGEMQGPRKTTSKIRGHKLRYEEQIQEGNFSETFSGTYRGNPCTILTLKKEMLQMATPELFSMFRAKVQTMETMTHRNIVRMLGYQTMPRPLVVLQRTEKGNLFQILKVACRKDNGYTFKRGFNIMLDIAAAMEFLHSKDFVHMNLKSASCYVDQDWKGKLGGLGHSLDLMSRINETVRSGGESEFGRIGWEGARKRREKERE